MSTSIEPQRAEPTAPHTDFVQPHTEAPAATPKPTASGSARLLGALFVLALLAVVAYGLYWRSNREHNLAQATGEASIPTVMVTHPVLSSAEQQLVLPGNVQAFTETPIYSRTNGYLRKWYFDIGAHVRRGQLLAEIETPEVDQQLEQSRAELERMEANAKLAGTTSDRWKSLLAKHAVSQQEADQTQSNFISAQAAVDASKANVRRLQELQSYEHIVAPFDGVITARNTDIGDLIDAGSGSATPHELFHLATTGKLRVYVAVPEVDADSIHDGATAIITQDSEPGRQFVGKVVRNSNAIDRASRTLNVEVDIDNSKGDLRPGAYVFVHFSLPGDAGRYTIPSNTLLFRAEGLRVGVVRDGRVVLTPVTIGQDYGNSVEVTSGVTPPDAIILDPSDSLTSGLRVNVNNKAATGKVQ